MTLQTFHPPATAVCKVHSAHLCLLRTTFDGRRPRLILKCKAQPIVGMFSSARLLALNSGAARRNMDTRAAPEPAVQAAGAQGSVVEPTAGSTEDAKQLTAVSKAPAGDAQQAGTATAADAQSPDAAPPEQDTQRTRVQLCAGLVPVAHMRCRTVCFTKAAGAKGVGPTADVQPGHAALQCSVLPYGPSLPSLQQVL